MFGTRNIDNGTLCGAGATTALGNTGQKGDFLGYLVVIPGTTSPGAVQIKDGGGSAQTVFTGGATSVADLKPFIIYITKCSVNGGWSIVNGSNVTAWAAGRFTG